MSLYNVRSDSEKCGNEFSSGKMIYIVGTHHELQHTGKILQKRAAPAVVEEARARFRSYLRQTAQELQPDVVAEELSQFVVNVKGGKSIAAEVAAELNIEHRLCDPDPGQRDKLGIGWADEQISQDRQFKIREDYWFDCIIDKIGSNVLFICGACHTSRFRELLLKKNCQSKILESYWGKEIYYEQC